MASAVTTPIRRRDERLPKIRLPSGVLASERQQLALRAHCVGEAAHTQVDGSQYLVTADVVGVALEMRLRLRDEACN